RQLSAPYYDRDEHQIRRWKEWTRETPDFHGMMYTTWQRGYDHLEPFGDYAWTHAPHIYHTPAWGLNPGQQTLFWTMIRGDKWDPDWELEASALHWRTRPGDPFQELAFEATPGQLEEVWLSVPEDATWLQWYVTATDNRGWTSRIPFADTMYYELGDIATAVRSLPEESGLHLACYPQPLSSGQPLSIEWYAPANTAAELTVHDVLGRRVFRTTLSGTGERLRSAQLRLPALSAGMYVLRLTTGTAMRSARIRIF
ncbi:MAG: hypothetical protein C0600_07685, partial [Ignavibacteria bacterium]